MTLCILGSVICHRHGLRLPKEISLLVKRSRGRKRRLKPFSRIKTCLEMDKLPHTSDTSLFLLYSEKGV